MVLSVETLNLIYIRIFRLQEVSFFAVEIQNKEAKQTRFGGKNAAELLFRELLCYRQLHCIFTALQSILY